MAGTRELILDEALRLFADKGIRETTVRDIARAVGITEGAIYRHFSSKDQIVYELFERYSSLLYDRLEEAVEKDLEDRERFEAMVGAFLNFAFKNPDAFKFMNIFHYLRGREVRKFKRLPVKIIRAMMDELIGKGVLHEDTEFALAVVIGTLERVFLYKSMGMIKGRRSEVISKTAGSLWNYLCRCGKS